MILLAGDCIAFLDSGVAVLDVEVRWFCLVLILLGICFIIW